MPTPVWLTIGALAVLLLAEWSGWKTAVKLAKPAASAGFLWATLDAGALESTYGRIVGGALLLSWVGDVALLSRQSKWFLTGLISFALGHIVYAFAFAQLGVSWVVVAIDIVGLMGPAWVVHSWLRPHLPDEMRRPVLIYIGVITVMVAMAAAAVREGASPVVLFGAVAFYLSDLSVARDRFVKAEFFNRAWGWPMYYFAQLVLASTVADALYSSSVALA